MTTYYVSSGIGSNNNAGTSESAPLATLQAAANLVQPGDTVEVMNGTYTGSAGGDVLNITTSGTASAPITFEAAPGQTPVINSSGCWQGINVQASYINIEGFTLVGDAANYNLQSALAGYSTGNASLDGQGIYIQPSSSVPVPNHITIENNTVYNEPGGGIATDAADYLQILNNVVYDNAHWSAFGNSGISIWESANSDTSPGIHDTVSGNLVYGNAQLVPTSGAGTITDGEGIILDTNPNFVGEMLVENNTAYGNGGPGIESNNTPNAVITNNTVYGNNTQNVQAASDAEIFINQSNNNTVTNNIGVPGVYGSTGVNVSNNTAGTSSSSSSSSTPTAPVISTGSANTNETVTLTGTAPAGSTVTVSDGSSTALGTATANSTTGAWSYTTPALAASSYTFTATDTTSAGTSAASSAVDVTVTSSSSSTGSSPPPTPTAPVISTGSANTNETVTLTGTAPAGSTVTVSDGSSTALGTATANSTTGAWSYTTPALAASSYTFTATDTTSAGTSAASSAVDVTVTSSSSSTGSSPPPTPTAPVISTGSANTNETVTLTGTAPAGSTVTVSDGSSTALGTATANSTTGAWSYTTPALAASSYTFTATDTTSAGTSAASSAVDVTVTSSSSSTGSSPPPSGSNLVGNGNFATGDFTDWTLGGNYTSTTGIYIDTNAEGGSTYATHMGSVGSDGTLSQTIATTAGQTYTLSFWLQNEGSGPDDFSAIWNGQTLLSLTNQAAFGYTQHTYTVTATSSSTVLEFSARQDPSNWDLDNISLTATGTSSSSTAAPSDPPPSAAPVIMSDVVHSNHSVTLKGTAPDGATVTVSDGGATPLGTATASSTGSWSFTTADLAAGSYTFSATDATSAGTSAASSPVDVTVRTAPAVQSGVVNISGTDPTVTLTGTSPDGTTVTVSDGGSTPLGTTTASSSGAWSFTTPDLPAGNYAFTVTDTTPTGTTTTSKPFDVTVPTPSAGGGASGLPRIAFDPPTTLGSWSNNNQTGSTSSFADIALLGNHIASSFALPSGSQGGTMVNSELSAFGT